jgi:hypothetical protein
MSRPLLPEIWNPIYHRHPLFSGYGTVCRGFDGWPSLDELTAQANQRGLRNQAGKDLAFVPQTERLSQRGYEQHIGQTGEVPTRSENWHDFLNACAWLSYPQTKAAINAVHCAQPKNLIRSPASDAATVFDESGAILLGPDPRLAQWLRDHDWQQAFVTHRCLWQQHRLFVFGHAVLEKTLRPYPGMIVKVLYQPWSAIPNIPTDEPPEGLDALVAKRWLEGEFANAAALFALPVLGIPGVDAANEDPVYYENTQVFRSARLPQTTPSCRAASLAKYESQT